MWVRVPLVLVIPAKAGIHSPSSSRRRPGSRFCVSIFRARAKTDSRPCELRRPSWPPSHFLLLVQEKVTKENTPSRPRFAGHPCPANFASALRGSLTVRPCTDSELARILRATLRAFPTPACRGREGPGEEQSAAGPAAEEALLLISGPSVTRRRADGSGRA